MNSSVIVLLSFLPLLVSCQQPSDIQIIDRLANIVEIDLDGFSSLKRTTNSAIGDYGEEITVSYSDAAVIERMISDIKSSDHYLDTLIIYEYSCREYLLSINKSKIWLKAPYGYRFERYGNREEFEVMGLDTARMKIHYTYNED